MFQQGFHGWPLETQLGCSHDEMLRDGAVGGWKGDNAAGSLEQTFLTQLHLCVRSVSKGLESV